LWKHPLRLKGEKSIISLENEIMQNQRHMWFAARKSDYGTDAAGVFFCAKRGFLWKTVTILLLLQHMSFRFGYSFTDERI
jgi:hypothetical protein